MKYADSVLDATSEDLLAAWLRRGLRNASALVLRTGFYSAPALEVAYDDIDAMLARGGEMVAVLGGDSLQVDIAAMRALLELCEEYPDSAQVLIVTEPEFQNAKTYHLTHDDGRSSAWVGSANFSLGGLIENLEAGITLISDEDDPHVVELVRAATLALARQPTAVPLSQTVIERLQQRVREARFAFGRANLGPVTPLVDGHGQQLLDDLDRIASGDHRLLMTCTGFPKLDDLLDGGLRPGTLTIVASRPGAGRSTLALNMVSHAAFAHHLPSCLFTFQSSEQDVLLRVLSAETGIDHGNLRRARMTDTDWTHTANRMVKLAEEPFHVNAGPPPHLEALCAAITSATIRANLAVVGVDPLTAVFARTFADNREREVAEVARRLQAVAIDLKVALIATAEIGRQADYTDQRPHLSDLRDSDVLAQVADHVILLDHHDRIEPNRTRSHFAHLILAKNRHGRRGSVPVIPDLSFCRFRPVLRPPNNSDTASPTTVGTSGAGRSSSPPPASLPLTTEATTPDPPAAPPAAPTRPAGSGSGQKGELVDTGFGAKIRIHSVGQGEPTVICLGRADPAADEWTELHTRLQSLTRIVSFAPRDFVVGDPLSRQVALGLRGVATAAGELDLLLWQSKIKPPYVIVASSIGCWLADQYAVREPRRVTGAVLIDPLNLTPWPISEHHRPTNGNDGETGYLQKPHMDSFVDLACHKPTESRRTVVISSSDGRWQRHTPASVTAWTPEALAEMDQRWQEFQRDWVGRTRARHVVADTAGHLVHRDQPDLVARVVTAVVEAARTKSVLQLDQTELRTAGGRLMPNVGKGRQGGSRPR